MKYEKLCLITDLIIKKLGFGEYNDGSGDFGYYRLNYDHTPPYIKNKNVYELGIYDEKDDWSDGYSDEPEYCDGHYFSGYDWDRIDYIHELYLDIKKLMPTEFVEIFEQKLKENNLWYYCKDLK